MSNVSKHETINILTAGFSLHTFGPGSPISPLKSPYIQSPHDG